MKTKERSKRWIYIGAFMWPLCGTNVDRGDEMKRRVWKAKERSGAEGMCGEEWGEEIEVD